MKEFKQYRINGFEQIKAFYSWVFNNAMNRVTPQHISLYLFLINQNNRNNWVEWFKCPLDLGMAGACIGNKKTYYNCLSDLAEWELIKYEKGINEFKAPLIKIEVLKSTPDDTAEVPQSEPLPIPQGTTLPIPLPTHIYKLITDNLKQLTDNYDEFEKFVFGLNQRNMIDYNLIIENYHSLCPKMSKVEKLTGKRKGYVNARYGEYGLDGITKVLRIAGESIFLNGSNERSWKADFEWLMRPENFVKVLEGKYTKEKARVKLSV